MYIILSIRIKYTAIYIWFFWYFKIRKIFVEPTVYVFVHSSTSTELIGAVIKFNNDTMVLNA